MDVPRLLLLSAQPSHGGAWHTQAGTGLPCEVQREPAGTSCLGVTALLLHIIKSQLQAVQLMNCPWSPGKLPLPRSSQEPSRRYSGVPAADCHMNLSALGEESPRLVFISLKAVPGSKMTAPASNPCLLSSYSGRILSQIQMRAGGTRPGHCHELPPPSWSCICTCVKHPLVHAMVPVCPDQPGLGGGG